MIYSAVHVHEALIKTSSALLDGPHEPQSPLKTNVSDGLTANERPATVTLVPSGLLELDASPSDSFPDFDLCPQVVEDLPREVIGERNSCGYIIRNWVDKNGTCRRYLN